MENNAGDFFLFFFFIFFRSSRFGAFSTILFDCPLGFYLSFPLGIIGVLQSLFPVKFAIIQ